jgi:diketogulonate reductase-like aldo/keto reductase
MEYRRMGRTGLQLSALSLGSWVTFHKQIEDNTADTLMGMAYDAGINFFDNAEGYAFGESEKMMGRVLQQKMGPYVLRPFFESIFWMESKQQTQSNWTESQTHHRSLPRGFGAFTNRLFRPLFLS